MSYPTFSIYKNRYGIWQIQRIAGEHGFRWLLSLLVNDHYVLVANQGRRKTCIELADANYRGALE